MVGSSITTAQQIAVDRDVATIKEVGMGSASQVMETASWLTDVYGPRLTGSTRLDSAMHWAEGQLKAWGIERVWQEAWGPFGRGWELEHFEMHANGVAYFPVLAYPKAWSRSTEGLVEGEVIYLEASTVEELEAYRGRLSDKFVLLDPVRDVNPWFDPPAKRNTTEELLRLSNEGMPAPSGPRRFFDRTGSSYSEALWKLFESEQPLAILDSNYKGDLGVVFVAGARASQGLARDPVEVIPQVTLAIEHYNRMMRLLKKGIPVTLSMELRARYTNEDGMCHNLIAEIPGTDLADEVVMFGAHIDSWHSGTGATDNAAGSAVMMEVARILQSTIDKTGLRPRRTLRLALWTGEEQGLLGSRAYVNNHLAEADPTGNPVLIKPAQQKVSAYYNLDNGTGRIRGIYLQGNEAVQSIFREWLDALGDPDARTLTLSNTGGTDHLPFDAVGIPAFQFIQDPVAYGSRTHHSNMDVWDHLIADDLKQAAIVIATFVLQTAQRDERLPRKALAEHIAQP